MLVIGLDTRHMKQSISHEMSIVTQVFGIDADLEQVQVELRTE